MIDNPVPYAPPDDDAAWSLDDVCRTCRVDAAFVLALVEHGVLEPVGASEAQWRFESITVVRVAKAKRLERDLELNPSGIALVFDLLAQIDDLRAQLRGSGS